MPATVRDLVSFDDPPPAPEVDHPRPERRRVGDPARTTWNRYTSPDERLFAGTWASEVGAWRIEVPAGQDELCVLLEGRVRLVDDEGGAREFGPGSVFVLPGGFHGTWETLAPLRKHYVLRTA